MLDSLYKLYLRDTLDLAKSIVVKSEATAEAINSELRMFGYEVYDTLPHTWKYYLNLNGQYHTSDEVMTITSIDTLETIEFRREVLAVHKSTKGLYAFGGSYYKALVKKYPRQEDLIRGILNPVDIDVAVNSRNHTILNYESGLVQPSETNLLSDLQKWIYNHYDRWIVDGYHQVADLYAASYLAVLFANIPVQILNIRLANCFTERAHDYHIWTYLKGKHRLHRFRRSLTDKQALFLYRNIRYLMDNAGKTSSFELLIERMLTERSIPAYGFNLRHNVEEQPEELTPLVEVVRFPLNTGLVSPDSQDIYDVYEMSDKITHLSRDNYIDAGIHAKNLEERFKHSSVNAVNTKIIESVVVSESKIADVDMDDVLETAWVTLAARKIYTANLLIPNPHTGDVLQMNPLDAYILYLHVYNISIGSWLPKIPKAHVSSILKDPAPDISTLRSIVEPRLWREDFQDALDLLPSEDRIINNIDFYDFCQRYYNVKVALVTAYKHHNLLHGRAQFEQVAKALEHREVFTLSDIETYDEWLLINEIEIDKISKSDAKTLADNIMAAVTGQDDSEALTPKIIQSDLIDVIDELTSYDLQFIKTVIAGDSFFVNANQVALDNPEAFGGHHNFLLNKLNIQMGGYYKAPAVNIPLPLDSLDMDAFGYNKIQVSNPVNVSSMIGRPKVTVHIPINHVRLTERTD